MSIMGLRHPAPPKALVVDDEHAFFRSIDLALHGKGWISIWCMDALSAAKAAADYIPDVILLDVHLPDGDGIDLVPRLRAEGYSGHIILVTGDTDAAARARREGVLVDDIFEKPFSGRFLHRYLAKLLCRT